MYEFHVIVEPPKSSIPVNLLNTHWPMWMRAIKEEIEDYCTCSDSVTLCNVENHTTYERNGEAVLEKIVLEVTNIASIAEVEELKVLIHDYIADLIEELIAVMSDCVTND